MLSQQGVSVLVCARYGVGESQLSFLCFPLQLSGNTGGTSVSIWDIEIWNGVDVTSKQDSV
jgi:hypothetical protein